MGCQKRLNNGPFTKCNSGPPPDAYTVRGGQAQQGGGPTARGWAAPPTPMVDMGSYGSVVVAKSGARAEKLTGVAAGMAAKSAKFNAGNLLATPRAKNEGPATGLLGSGGRTANTEESFVFYYQDGSDEWKTAVGDLLDRMSLDKQAEGRLTVSGDGSLDGSDDDAPFLRGLVLVALSLVDNTANQSGSTWSGILPPPPPVYSCDESSSATSSAALSSQLKQQLIVKQLCQ